jgi:transcriptional regulator with XRE-family HTH domain
VDLRTILSQNIKNARKTLHITQAKLAEYAEISLSYLVDIERQRTWVSDKTLQNLAKALDMKPWELLVPRTELETGVENEKEERKRGIAELITRKKEILHCAADEAMEDLIMQILKER